jgi:o-succinylbenzoate synthase
MNVDPATGSPVTFSKKIVEADVLRRDVPLRRPLPGTGGEVSERRLRVLRLRSENGVIGLGEASAVTWLGADIADAIDIALDAIVETIRTKKPAAKGLLDSSIEKVPLSAVRSALATAVLDLEARRIGMSVARLLRPGDRTRSLPVCALLADADPVTMAAEARRYVARGFKCFKIKVGKAGLAEDAVRVATVRATVGPDASIRLDANRAWTVVEARRALERFKPSAPEFIEEPLHDSTLVTELKAADQIALDESIATHEQLDAAIERGGFGTLVIKLERVGGPIVALEMAEKAAKAGLDFVFTDSIDGAVGRAATLHVAAAAAGKTGTGILPVGLGGLFAMGDAEPSVDAALRGPGLGVEDAEP